MSRNTEESQIQQSLVLWARLNRQKYPELEHLYAIPNGAATTKGNRIRLVKEGLVSGVSDLHLPVSRNGFIGLWIEVKSKKGKLSGEQTKWLDAMRSYGHDVHLCRDWYMTTIILQQYLDS